MSDSYYGRPIVKPHQWKPEVPAYFWIGGTAGAAAVGCTVARIRGAHGLARVFKRTALAGALASPILLTLDLGVPLRFYNMFRVFKPTSPMNLGSWVLTAFGGALTASTLAELCGVKAASVIGELAAAALGPVVTTYTAVLISNTATPVWHEAYEGLPFVFIASGLAGAGAVGVLFAPPEERGIARRAMVLGSLGMGAGMQGMQVGLGPLLSEPYHEGKAGAMHGAATLLGLAGASLGVIGRKNRFVSSTAALCTIAAGVLERFTIFQAGKQSAQDPKYVVESQRARLALRALAHELPQHDERGQESEHAEHRMEHHAQ